MIGASLRRVGWKAGLGEVSGERGPLTSAGPNFSPELQAALQEMLLLEVAPSPWAGSVPRWRSACAGAAGPSSAPGSGRRDRALLRERSALLTALAWTRAQVNGSFVTVHVSV